MWLIIIGTFLLVFEFTISKIVGLKGAFYKKITKKGRVKDVPSTLGWMDIVAGVILLGFGVLKEVKSFQGDQRIENAVTVVESNQRHLSKADKDSLLKIEPYKQFEVLIVSANNSEENISYAKEIRKYLQEQGFSNPYLAGVHADEDSVFRIKVRGLITENDTLKYSEVDIGLSH